MLDPGIAIALYAGDAHVHGRVHTYFNTGTRVLEYGIE